MKRAAKSSSEPTLEQRARERGLKANSKLAEQFGITPGADPPRELVSVDSLPDPPNANEPVAPSRREQTVEANPEDRVEMIVAEELEELGTRLARFGVLFNPAQKQSVRDYTMSVLIGYGGGGSIARRHQ